MNIATWIEANAGTGKTSRLTDEIVRRFRDGVKFDRVCAVTFTEKAANEMVERLRWKVVELVGRGEAAPDALDRMNESFVGTIHAFCNRILKRYGNRLSLPPLFAVDSEGDVFQKLFDTRWDRFLAHQLKTRGDHESYVTVFGLNTLYEMAERLAQRRYEFRPVESEDLEWLVQDLQDTKKWDLTARGWVQMILQALKEDPANRDVIEVVLEANTLDNTAWKNALLDLIRCRHKQMHSCLQWLKQNFVQQLLEEYRALGYLRFDDMILDTRELLKNDLEVRRELKARYDVVLVDEMQDTDPVQYEIFLYLSEKNGREKDFTLREVINGSRQLSLEPGKFFGVGDPKQSIYGFRSADIGAYEAVKTMLITAGVAIEPLVTNYRSCANLVNFTNQLARRLFGASNPENSNSVNTYCSGRPVLDCVHLVELECEQAREQHLRILTEANWLATRVKSLISDPQAPRSPQQIGILLRKLTHAHLYVDALNSRNIRVVIEGERFFYQSQEVIDFLNLLKYTVDEMDTIALAGMLRSPLFHMTDPELADFFYHYRSGKRIFESLEASVSGDPQRLATLAKFLESIGALRNELKEMTPGRLIDQVFARLPVLTVAGLAYGISRREMAPLNLLKIHKLALEADDEPEMTAMRFVRTLESFSKEAKQQGQEAMADEVFPAVRIMSIHQSKGLDFPVLFVPLSDYGIGNYEDATKVKYDWKTNVAGLKINRFTEANYLRLRYGPGELQIVPPAEDALLSQIEDEERRVLYVASTRAKEEIYFSYVPWVGRKDSNAGRPIMDLMSDVLSELTVENKPLTVQLSSPWLEPSAELIIAPATSVQDVTAAWKRVEEAGMKRALPLHTSVTEEASQEEEPVIESLYQYISTESQIIGLICHAVMERIDFKNPQDYKRSLQLAGIELQGTFSEQDVRHALEKSGSILEAFFRSEAAAWLADVEIYGREVPVYLFDPEAGKILSGKIDLLARQKDVLHLIDYKTNIELDSAAKKAYARQLELYARAIHPIAPNFTLRRRLCLLRHGVFIDV